MANIEYTKKWTNKDFDNKQVGHYDAKFYTRFEKNIKHRQQIKLIKKYLKPDMKWIDAPIGSGRLMDSIAHPQENSFGFDLSISFIEHNRDKGINCIEGDLFQMDFNEEFDFLTSLHTIFAFNDFRKILLNYVKALKREGYLVVDIVNLHLYDDFSIDKKADKSVNINGMKLEEIYLFFNNLNCEVLEVIPHDYFDSEKILFWRMNGNKITKKFKSLIWKILNKLYFKLNLFNLFDLLEDKEKIDLFNKFLVVVRKK